MRVQAYFTLTKIKRKNNPTQWPPRAPRFTFAVGHKTIIKNKFLKKY